MKKKTNALPLVSTNFTTIEADADVLAIRQIFNQSAERFLPVVRGAKFVGVILREDFLRKFVASDDYLLSAKDLISKEMVKLLPENTVGDAREVFDTNVFSVLPIADEAGTLIGLLLREDLERELRAVPAPLRERFARLRPIGVAG